MTFMLWCTKNPTVFIMNWSKQETGFAIMQHEKIHGKMQRTSLLCRCMETSLLSKLIFNPSRNKIYPNWRRGLNCYTTNNSWHWKLKQFKCYTTNVTSTFLRDNIYITINKIKNVSMSDPQYQKLMKKLQNGTSRDTEYDVPEIRPCFNIRDCLSINYYVTMYKFHEKHLLVVITKVLQNQLTKPCQGTTSMLEWAQQSIYWPGNNNDINNLVAKCELCKQISLSQQKITTDNDTISIFPLSILCHRYIWKEDTNIWYMLNYSLDL